MKTKTLTPVIGHHWRNVIFRFDFRFSGY